MFQFKDLDIKPKVQSLEGDKIKIDRILNKPITVHSFEIKPSKFEGDCLYLQTTVDGAKRVVFTGSTFLADMIKKVPADKFPFTTTIIKENESFQFT